MTSSTDGGLVEASQAAPVIRELGRSFGEPSESAIVLGEDEITPADDRLGERLPPQHPVTHRRGPKARAALSARGAIGVPGPVTDVGSTAALCGRRGGGGAALCG